MEGARLRVMELDAQNFDSTARAATRDEVKARSSRIYDLLRMIEEAASTPPRIGQHSGSACVAQTVCLDQRPASAVVGHEDDPHALRKKCLQTMRSWIDDDVASSAPPLPVTSEKVTRGHPELSPGIERRRTARAALPASVLDARLLLKSRCKPLLDKASTHRLLLRSQALGTCAHDDQHFQHYDVSRATLMCALRTHEKAKQLDLKQRFAALYADPRSLGVNLEAVTSMRRLQRERAASFAAAAVVARQSWIAHRDERARAQTSESRQLRRIARRETELASLQARRTACWLQAIACARGCVGLGVVYCRFTALHANRRARLALNAFQDPARRHLAVARERVATRRLRWFLGSLLRQRTLRIAVSTYARDIRIVRRFLRRRLLRSRAEFRICCEHWDRLDLCVDSSSPPPCLHETRTATYQSPLAACILTRLKHRALRELIAKVHLDRRQRFAAQKLGLQQSRPVCCAPAFPTCELVDDETMRACIRTTKEKCASQLKLAKSIMSLLRQ